jgi:predicted Kef-type K+ transport protein
LVAGILIGPATPGFVAMLLLKSQLSEIGVMLFMFGVGLHLSINDLTVKRIASYLVPLLCKWQSLANFAWRIRGLATACWAYLVWHYRAPVVLLKR